jgi:hypothetical protein
VQAEASEVGRAEGGTLKHATPLRPQPPLASSQAGCRGVIRGGGEGEEGGVMHDSFFYIDSRHALKPHPHTRGITAQFLCAEGVVPMQEVIYRMFSNTSLLLLEVEGTVTAGDIWIH